MKALLLKETNQPLAFDDCPEPEAGPGQVIVDLKAAALNRRDFWITQGMYPGVQAPCILGSDGAGVASATGQEVIICPSIDWGDDPAAQQESYRILGMPDHGTFAERIAVAEGQVAAKPAHLSWAEAAALPLAGLTAFRALFTQGRLQSGQTVLVTGIGGGVATFALQFAVAAGAKVLVTSSSAGKIERAVACGAIAGANYREDGWAKALGQAHGPIDLVIDSAGGDGYNDLMEIVKAGGRIVNYGATTGPPRKLDLFKLFWKQLHLIGSTMGSPAEFASMVGFVNERKIKPIVDQIAPLAEGSEVVAAMAASPQFGKLVLEIGG